MKLSPKTLESLNNVITGDKGNSPYRKGYQLVEFFNDFGEGDLYGQGFPARPFYVREKLQKFNGTETMMSIVSHAFDFVGEEGFNAEDVAYQFNQILARDGFRLVFVDDYGWMEGDREVRINPRFEVRALGPQVLAPTSLAAISNEAINEQVQKAHQKIETGDYPGAITNAYTLVEHLLKLLLAEVGATARDTEGGIRALYRSLQVEMNLDPANLEQSLKPIAGGLQTLVGGIYEMANKRSDRHARQFNPARHHAKITVNAAFALCDFLVESRIDQLGRTKAATDSV